MSVATKSIRHRPDSGPRRKLLAAAVEITFAIALSNTALAANTFFVTTLSDNGAGSLRQAITNANNVTNPVSSAVIAFQGGLTGTITLTTGEIAITNPVNIEGPGADKLTISGSGTSRVFNVNESGLNGIFTTTVSGLTLQNGYSSGDGGAVYVYYAYDFVMKNCVIQKNVADAAGAGLFVKASSYLTLSGDTFITNQAGAAGGGFLVKSSQATISNVDSEHNMGTAGAGGYLGGGGSGTATISSSQFSNNTGGGLEFIGTGASISNSEISANYFVGYGAGVDATKVTGLTISGSRIEGNSATRGGGGVFANVINTTTSAVTVSHSTLDGNQVVATGGGGKGTTSEGGGIFIKNAAKVEIQYSTISNNNAATGGGIAVINGSYLLNASLYDTTIAGNTATSDAGALISSSNAASTLIIESTTIAANSATKQLGGIDVSRIPSTFHDSIVFNNSVGGAAGSDVRGNFTANFSLFGSSSDSTINGDNNLIGVDPMLGPLGDYGGGVATMLPANGSPAIDAGDPTYNASTLPSNDERGFARVVGSAIDMGAVEVQTVEDTIFLSGFESD